MSAFTLSYRTIHTTHEAFFTTYTCQSSEEDRHIFLESGRGGRYSMAGIRPFAWARGEKNELTVYEQGTEQTLEGDPLHLLIDWMKPYKHEPVPSLPDFQGGAMGYISYDYVRSIEQLPEIAVNDHGLPDLYFMIFDQWLVFDHQTNLLYFMVLHKEGEGRDTMLDQWVASWQEGINQENRGKAGGNVGEEKSSPLEFSMDEGRFSQAAEAIRTYIAQGDVFQVNLSVRQSKKLIAEPLSIYQELRTFNPSPYMSYVHMPDEQIVSASPELLIKKSGTELSTRPIAGTRSRGENQEEDQRLANELIQNEKERAEHVMLVDLERNDLGRVSRYGTVEVNEFMVIERYSHVMHIVSNVRGQLDPSYNEADVIRAVFPGGTITGAPKVRTMEIIEELEPVRRGLYTGSIGWIGFNGDMELNIVIRTMLAQNGVGHVQAGAGVVIDSHPKREYKESLKKAQALWHANDLAEGKEMTT
ncbi:anthranilate synthase component I family protein [Jeotgalibacillus sp. ET6]|uniref:anthranilate synthase component I family protein n=1 Tax=Jeotgalibacillus sp. ET6 TaxID=3037260 RepID=UPI0024181E3F|nr:anthranilate synthase component I family protein [Jeotgalibacillus sp. ET6]MDG5473805.1 anthranilate synthase component I family protein [Jeotgalibacillus sp. ET6]